METIEQYVLRRRLNEGPKVVNGKELSYKAEVEAEYKANENALVVE